MPWTTNPLARGEARNSVAHGHDITHDFVAGHARKHIAHPSLASGMVAEADTARQHLNEQLAWTRMLELHVTEHEGFASGLEDGSLVCRGKC